MNYQMSIKAIKSILLKEHESFMYSMRERVYRLDYNVYLLDMANEQAIKQIESAQTYQHLEEFINESRRMSLQEWIDSL